MDEFEIRVVTVPIHDTGIGKEAGYSSDAEMMKAAADARAAMSVDARRIMDAIDEEIDQVILFGDGNIKE